MPSSVLPERSQFPRANSLGFLAWDRERRDRFWGEGMSPRDQAGGTTQGTLFLSIPRPVYHIQCVTENLLGSCPE